MPEPDPNWPRWLYHRSKPALIVQSQAEQDALGPGWARMPFTSDDPAPSPDVPEPEEPEPDVPEEPEEHLPADREPLAGLRRRLGARRPKRIHG